MCEQVSLVHLVFLELAVFLDPLSLDHWANLVHLDPPAQWDHQVRHLKPYCNRNVIIMLLSAWTVSIKYNQAVHEVPILHVWSLWR